MSSFLSSKVVVREEEPALRQIDAASTSIAGFVGVAERGPVNVATLITSFAQFQEVFGGYLTGASRHLPLAVAAFFENGGSACYVVRVAHLTDSSDATTLTATRSTAILTAGGGEAPARLTGAAYPLALEPGDALILSVNEGADATATFTATAAKLDSDGGPFVLVDGQVLAVKIDGGAVQAIAISEDDFDDVGAATAAEVADVINRSLRGGRAFVNAGAVRIESDTRGTDSSVEVTAATTADGLGFAEGAPDTGTGNVGTIDAVTQAEAEAVIEAAIAGVAVEAGASLSIATTLEGADASITVQNGTAAAFDVSGTEEGSEDATVNVIRVEELHPAGLEFPVEVKAATSGAAARFDLLFSAGGVVVEAYRNVSADPDADDYVVSVLAASSKRFRAVHLGAAGDPRPANQSKTIQGGSTGLAGLVDADFIGGDGANGKTGLRALDPVLDLSILAVPGRASAAMAAAMVSYCATTRGGRVFGIFDAPEGSSETAAITYFESTASLLNATEHGACYWPWVKVANPSVGIFGSEESLTVAPSGAVAGTYARVDGARDGGVYDSPAGFERAALRGVIGLESDRVNEEAVRDLLYPKRINPIRTAPGRPIYLDGGRTLKAGGNFPNIAERRGVSMIARSIESGIDFARHSNNDSTLRGRIRRTVRAFLVRQMGLGAFRSRVPETAFYLQCDEVNNPPEVVFAGRVVLRVGLATQKPAEFIEVVISQDTRAFAA